jgi:hypothetical protein
VITPRHTNILLFETALLLTSFLLIEFSPLVAGLITAYCMGMQNSLSGKMSGYAMRTTHLTGMATDIGTVLGMRLARDGGEAWRLKLNVYAYFSFAAGAVGGYLMEYWIGDRALIGPIIFTGLTALILNWKKSKEDTMYVLENGRLFLKRPIDEIALLIRPESRVKKTMPILQPSTSQDQLLQKKTATPSTLQQRRSHENIETVITK